MTEPLFAKLRELEKKACQAPWDTILYDNGRCSACIGWVSSDEESEIELSSAINLIQNEIDADVSLIAAARNTLPKLFEALDLMEQALNFYAGPWGIHQNSGDSQMDVFIQTKLNTLGQEARNALAKVKEIGK